MLERLPKGVLSDMDGNTVASCLYEYDLVRIAPDAVELC